jgi:hypothetical protein
MQKARGMQVTHEINLVGFSEVIASVAASGIIDHVLAWFHLFYFYRFLSIGTIGMDGL